MALSTKQQEFAIMAAKLILFAEAKGFSVTLGEAYRTQEQQDIHRAAGHSSVKYSRHQDRLAIDLNLFIDGEYATHKEDYRFLGEYWEFQLGGRWGGRFGVAKDKYDTEIGWDSNHFEYRIG